MSLCKAIFRKFLSFPLEYIPLRVLSFTVSVAMTVTLLVSDDKGLISFHEMRCPMLLFLDTWTEVILRIQLIWWLNWSLLLSTPSKEFLRHSIPEIPLSGRPHTFGQFHQIFRNKLYLGSESKMGPADENKRADVDNALNPYNTICDMIGSNPCQDIDSPEKQWYAVAVSS